MHFDIARRPNPKLSEHHPAGSGWVISHDLGWTLHSHGGTQVLHKGLAGNWCSISLDHTGWSIDTPPERSFPLWTNAAQDRVSNCQPLGERIHNFNQVSHDGDSLQRRWQEPHWFGGVKRGLPVMTTQGVVDRVCGELVSQARSLDTKGLPIRAAATGGVDSALVRAVRGRRFPGRSFCPRTFADIGRRLLEPRPDESESSCNTSYPSPVFD